MSVHEWYLDISVILTQILIVLQSWITEMAPYFHSVDPNHLLTVGEEGYYAAGR